LRLPPCARSDVQCSHYVIHGFFWDGPSLWLGGRSHCKPGAFP